MTTLLCESVLRGYAGIDLTDNQREALQSLLQWREEKQHAVLEGFAGTGKTTVLQALITELAIRGETEGLYVTAPTHKAAQVLNQKIAEFCSKAGVEVPTEVGTIHSRLSLKPKRTKPGEPEEFSTSKQPRLTPGGYLIVDECSMVGRFLYDYTMECAANYDVTVLFCGDPKQLRPVNESGTSRCFGLGGKVSLTEVLRHDGAVLNLATAIRTMHKFALPVVKTDVRGGSRVSTYASAESLRSHWLDQVASEHEAPAAGGSSSVLLCWTNRERRAANRRARERIYGPEVPEFMAGDELVMLAPLTVGDTVLLANNADIRITGAEQIEWSPIEGLDLSYSCWRLYVEDFGDIHVLAASELGRHKKDWQRIGKEIAAEADVAKAAYDKVATEVGKSNHRHPRLLAAMEKIRDIKARWGEEYYALKEVFAQVDHRYALTVHKSQGSTYQSVFVHPDMLHAKEERPALMYVAVTRAAKEVHHLALG